MLSLSLSLQAAIKKDKAEKKALEKKLTDIVENLKFERNINKAPENQLITY